MKTAVQRIFAVLVLALFLSSVAAFAQYDQDDQEDVVSDDNDIKNTPTARGPQHIKLQPMKGKNMMEKAMIPFAKVGEGLTPEKIEKFEQEKKNYMDKKKELHPHLMEAKKNFKTLRNIPPETRVKLIEFWINGAGIILERWKMRVNEIENSPAFTEAISKLETLKADLESLIADGQLSDDELDKAETTVKSIGSLIREVRSVFRNKPNLPENIAEKKDTVVTKLKGVVEKLEAMKQSHPNRGIDEAIARINANINRVKENGPAIRSALDAIKNDLVAITPTLSNKPNTIGNVPGSGDGEEETETEEERRVTIQ